MDEHLVVCKLRDGEQDLDLQGGRAAGGEGEGDVLVGLFGLLGEEVRVWGLEVELNYSTQLGRFLIVSAV